MQISSESIREKVTAAADYIRHQTELQPEVAIILGSAFSELADSVETEIRVAFDAIPHFPVPNAPTHAGNLVLGTTAGKKVMLLQGRCHAYEGYDLSQTTFPVIVAAAMGVKTLITTNLCGGINPEFKTGDFMVIEDHINLGGVNPLQWTDQLPPGRFTDMFQAYAPDLIQCLAGIAQRLQIKLQRGVLAYLQGPSFETRAELIMLKGLGADAVGWSVVPEVLVARRYDMRVLGLSCISDISNPQQFSPVDLDALYQVGLDKTPLLRRLLQELVADI